MECRLILYTNLVDKLNLVLHETMQDNISLNQKKYDVVYSDMDYDISLEFDESVESIEVYINNEFKQTYYDNGNIYFKDTEILDKKIFLNHFGYANFTIYIKTLEKTYEFYSDYLEVAVRDNITSELVRKMIKYITENSYKYLFQEESNVRDFVDVRKSNNKNLDTEISMLENILFEYETNFKFFKNATKYTTISSYIIDDFEKLKEIKNETIQYIVSNPQQLTIVNHNTGIKYNKFNLQPKKTLIDKNEISYNIYENQVVLGFLKYIYKLILEKIKEIEKYINNSQNQYIIRPYVSSAYKMYEITNKALCIHKKRLHEIKSKIQGIYFMYKNVLKCFKV
ncbi:DUF2357 domain-containing protein [Clostridium sp. LCP25S3_F8]|uniref:DUF2357 domain-containing protein n=1 Tax=Clostridium sp. LCP25S3_F8 TaxID=3438751 RepID=UPI003F8DF1F4